MFYRVGYLLSFIKCYCIAGIRRRSHAEQSLRSFHVRRSFHSHFLPQTCRYQTWRGEIGDISLNKNAVVQTHGISVYLCLSQ